MRILISISLVFLFQCFLMGQLNPERYKQEIFSQVLETNNIRFSTNITNAKPAGNFIEWVVGLPIDVREYQSINLSLYMDIFEPLGDTLTKRPVVILCFGGGFLDGERSYWSIRLIAQNLAKRGYVVASIDYRLGMNVFDQDLAARAVYRGVQDSRSAVRFFKANAEGTNNYRIDPERIMIGGHSAGAFIALHNLYMDKDVERPISTRTWEQDDIGIPDQGCLDCVGDNQGFEGRAVGGFSIAGAIGFTSYIEDEPSPYIGMFHSADDPTVPIGSGKPFPQFSDITKLPTVFGSDSIEQRFIQLGQPYDYERYTNRGHYPHESGSSSLQTDIMPSISTWLFDNYLEPEQLEISGIDKFCISDPESRFEVVNSSGLKTYWAVEGGTLINENGGQVVEVQWDLEAPAHSIQLTPFSQNDASGPSTILEVSTTTGSTNMWSGNSGSWSDPQHWSLGRTPLTCDDVTIPTLSSSGQILLPGTTLVKVKSLQLGQNVNLVIPDNTALVVGN